MKTTTEKVIDVNPKHVKKVIKKAGSTVVSNLQLNPFAEDTDIVPTPIFYIDVGSCHNGSGRQ